MNIVELLLKQDGLDVNHSDKYGFTALMFASHYGHANIIELLLQHPGINVNQTNNKGRTALIIASDKSHHSITELLKRGSKRIQSHPPL